MALRGFQEKKMARKVLFSVPVAIFLWVVVLWVAWKSVSLWSAKSELDRSLESLKAEIETAEESTKNIEKKMESLRSEYGIDLEARGKFNLTKPGEKVVIFAEEKENNKSSADNKNFFASIADWLTNIFSFQKNGE